jgi:hypothetical protein
MHNCCKLFGRTGEQEGEAGPTFPHSLCLPFSLVLVLPLYLLPGYLSTCLAVYLSSCLPVYLSTCPPVCLSTCLPVYLSNCLSVVLSTALPFSSKYHLQSLFHKFAYCVYSTYCATISQCIVIVANYLAEPMNKKEKLDRLSPILSVSFSHFFLVLPPHLSPWLPVYLSSCLPV